MQKQHEPEEPRFLDFPHLPDDATTPDGRPRLNRYSSTLTKDHDFPGAQVASYLRCCREYQMTLTKGDALRRGGSRSRDDEEQPACRRRLCLVGRQSLQVGSDERQFKESC